MLSRTGALLTFRCFLSSSSGFFPATSDPSSPTSSTFTVENLWKIILIWVGELRVDWRVGPAVGEILGTAPELQESLDTIQGCPGWDFGVSVQGQDSLADPSSGYSTVLRFSFLLAMTDVGKSVNILIPTCHPNFKANVGKGAQGRREEILGKKEDIFHLN